MLAPEPIAITGIGCRYPGGANDAPSFWKLVSDGVDAIREIPPDRWNIDKFYDPRPGTPGKSISKWGGFIDHIEDFDAGFFRISAREAPCIDPQQRLLLQTAWEALEDAGETMESIQGTAAGVFVGISATDYCSMQVSPAKPGGVDMWSATGGLVSIAANRISFSFDLRGPSMSIDTACSSSLVALHLACESLRRGECPMALVGGVNALLLPTPFINFSTANMLSPDGRCKAFDATANGYVRAEGAGVIVLKPLAAALTAGDLVYAVIRGTACNQDGRNEGMTIPSGAAQAELVRAACRSAGVAPGDIQYVEAHGTGTAVGDPIEAGALGAVLGEGRPPEQPCLVGSVKTNIGHLEAGAGVAGVIKAALSLHHDKIPPSLHCSKLNPRIDFEALKLKVATTTLAYRDGCPRLAGVNSFGFGGANAHAVLEAAPSRSIRAARPPGRAGLLVLSARSEKSLRGLASHHARHLAELRDTDLSDVCHTLATHRTHHAHRLAVLAEDRDRARARLEAYAANGSADACWESDGQDLGPPVFVFCGQGSQQPGMGAELYEEEPLFRETLDRCAAVFQSLAGWDLIDELRREGDASRLEQTEFAQPAIFAVQMGIVSLLEEWGVRPAAIAGHSVGEVAAACACGALQLEDAARVILERARSMAWPSGEGRMLSASIPAADVIEFLKGHEKHVSIGAVNSPRTVVLSGDKPHLEEIAARLQANGIALRWLPVKYSFHSHHVDPSRAPLLKALGKIRVRQPTVRMVSTVHGGDAQQTDFDAGYWWANVRNPVFFSEAIRKLGKGGHRLFLEIGPQAVLARPIMESLGADGIRDGRVLATLRRGGRERTAFLETLGRLHVQGHPINWRPVFAPAQRLRLPPYAWSPESHWREDAAWRQSRLEAPGHPLLGRRQQSESPVWQTDLDLATEAYLLDHRVRGQAVLPGAAYLEIALAAARELHPDSERLRVSDIDLRKPLILSSSGEPPSLRTVVRGGDWQILSSAGGAPWSVHAAGRFEAALPGDAETIVPRTKMSELPPGPEPEDFYPRMASTGLEFGPLFQGVRRVWRRDGEALAEVGTACANDSRYGVHPALFDACLQVLSQALPEGNTALYLPVGARQVTLVRSPKTPAWCLAELTAFGNRTLAGNIRVADEEGNVILTVEGLTCRAVGSGRSRASETGYYAWSWVPRADEPGAPSRAPELADFSAGEFSRDAESAEIHRALDLIAAGAVARVAEREPGAAAQARLAGLAQHARPAPPEAARKLVAAHPRAWPELALIANAEQAIEAFARDGTERPGPWTPAREVIALAAASPAAAGPLAEAVAAFIAGAPPNAPLKVMALGADRAAVVARALERSGREHVSLVVADSRAGAGAAIAERFRSAAAPWPTGGNEELPAGTFDLVVFTAGCARGDEDIGAASKLLRPLGTLLFETRDAPGVFERIVSGVIADGDRPTSSAELPELGPVRPLCKAGGFSLVAARKCGTEAQAEARRDPRSPGAWAILADGSGVAEAAEQALGALGARTLIIRPGNISEFAGREWRVAEDDDTGYGRLASALREHFGEPLAGVLHLWNLDSSVQTDDASCLRRRSYTVALLARALASYQAMPRLIVATRGSQPAAGGATGDPRQGAAWGLSRVLENELPRLKIQMLDLDPASTAVEQAADLLAEISRADTEDEVAIRGGRRMVHRLGRRDPNLQQDASARPFAWELAPPGADNALARKDQVAASPLAGEVEIDVVAAGLNFRDVMKSLGIYPGDRDEDFVLGDECSGRIVSVGPGVEGLRPGDEVIAIAPGSFASRVIAPAQSVARKPANLDFASAATVPVAFLTAWYGLRELARLRPGETALIHAAAGGVGLAALQIARHTGAHVIATAGSEEKRAFLRSLGIEHVLDSRGLSFGAEAMEITGGKGVDVVLNSLAGEAIACGLNCLARHGRFVEIGKRDIYSNSAFGLRAFRNGISLHAFDLGEVMKNRPGECRAMLQEICALMGRQEISPLPHQNFPMGDAPRAFREMSQGRHIGKIVLVADSAPAALAARPKLFRQDATYLVTGGTRGFGLSVAEWMAEEGARHLLLVSRSARQTEESAAALDRLRACGAEPVLCAADVSSEADVSALLHDIPASRPLAGIFHAAAVIEDSTVQNLTAETFDKVARGKACGALNLHRLTKEMPLDHFVVFSSVALTLGNPGQAAYCAANGVLQSLSEERRAHGLPALCIDWGAIAEVGHAARHQGLIETLSKAGFESLSPAETRQILATMLRAGPATITAAKIDWSRAAQTMRAVSAMPKFSEVASGDAAATASAESLRASLQTLPEPERQETVKAEVARLVAKVLRTTPDKLDLGSPLQDAGFDSLMAIELMNAIERRFELALPASAISSSATAAQVAETVCGLAVASRPEENSPQPSPRSEQGGARPAAASAAVTGASPEPGPARAATPLKHRAEALALRALQSAFRGRTQPEARRMLKRVIPAIRPFLSTDLRWARKNLRAIFGPALPDKQVDKLALLALENHLLSYVEGMCGEGREEVFENYDVLLQAHGAGRGAVLCGVHLGSWEPLLRWAPRFGLPLVAVYRRAHNPLSDRMFQEARAAYGIRWLTSDDTAGMAKALEDGCVLGMMTDLNTWSGATFADFLGLDAACPAGPAALAIHSGAPLVPAVAVREAGTTTRIVFGEAIGAAGASVDAESVRDITRRVNAAFEPWITEYAEQYNWLHPRWRARPDGSAWELSTPDELIARARKAPFLKLAPRVRALIS